MKTRWTRRRFLEVGLTGSIAAGSGALGCLGQASATVPAPGAKSAAAELEPQERALLRAAVEEIIPAGDGMPSASEVGAVEYLDRLASEAPDIKKALRESLTALQGVSRRVFKKGFTALAHSDRVTVLTKLEKQSAPEPFKELRDLTYEAYYTNPRVWKLVGYEPHPTNGPGPHMKPFDEASLAKVRQMPKFYREA